MKIYKGEFDKKLELQIAPAIMAGFPSPAEEYFSETLDFNRDMIRHPESTFYGRVKGDSMVDVGIEEGDIAVIDKSIIAEHGDIVIAYLNGEFNVKRLDMSHKDDGYIELKSENPSGPYFRINDDDDFQVWGVVVYTIKQWKK